MPTGIKRINAAAPASNVIIGPADVGIAILDTGEQLQQLLTPIYLPALAIANVRAPKT